jgi:hypothetical protein
MATIRLPADFRDFLRLLNSHRVEYLLVGGYAVCYHGHYRNTGDIDFWIAVHPENAAKLVKLIREFGFDVPDLSEELFLQKGRIIRMGIEPVRIELLTEISGCEFTDCYGRKIEATIDAIPVSIISLPDLLKNKLRAGRVKDLDDASKLS